MKFKELLQIIGPIYENSGEHTEGGGLFIGDPSAPRLPSTLTDKGTFNIKLPRSLDAINALLYAMGQKDFVDPDSVLNVVRQKLNHFGFDFQYTSYRLAGPVGLAGGANPTGSYKINSQARSAKFIVCGVRDNNNAAFNQDICFDNESNLTSFQLKIGNNIIPNQPMLYGAQSRVEVKEMLNQVGLYNELGNITRSQYLSTTAYTTSTAITTGSPSCANKAWFGINLEKFQTQLIQSGEDFMAKDIVLDLNAGSTVATAKSLFVFVVFDAVLTLNSLYNAVVSF